MYYVTGGNVATTLCTGAPQPMNILGSPTNTSVTLLWELPEGARLDEEAYYNVRMQLFCVFMVLVYINVCVLIMIH